MKKVIALVISSIVILSMSMVFVGCQSQREEKVLIIGTTSEISSPNRLDYNFDIMMATLSQATLFYIDQNGEYAPRIANFETEDSQSWIFTIKDGAKWSDGESVTAEDVLFSVDYTDEQEGTAYRKGFESIEILSENQILFKTESPNPRGLSTLSSLRLVPKHIFDGVENMATVSPEIGNIGVGPYDFVNYDENSGSIIFEKSSTSIFKSSDYDKVVFKIFKSEDSLYMALQMGEIDIAYNYGQSVNAGVYQTLKNDENISLQEVVNTSIPALICFNNQREPFDNINFKKGLAYAIDYNKFKEVFGTEFSKTACQNFVPEGTLGYVAMAENVRDIEKANEYLDKAGIVDSDGDGIRELDGKNYTAEVLVRSDNLTHLRCAELLQSNFAEVGIDLEIVLKESAQFSTVTEKDRNFDMIINRYTEYGVSMKGGLATGYLDGRDLYGVGNIVEEEFVNIVDGLKSSSSQSQYVDYAKLCQEYYAENIPVIALYWDSSIQAVSSKLEGFTINASYGVLNFDTFANIKEIE